MFSFLKKIFHKRSLKDKGIIYVRNHFGEEFVDEFIEKYDKINMGTPIGNMYETMMFVNLIEEIKKAEV